MAKNEEQPTQGGSYTRQPDGSLTRTPEADSQSTESKPTSKKR